jgi:hypothetical protein
VGSKLIREGRSRGRRKGKKGKKRKKGRRGRRRERKRKKRGINKKKTRKYLSLYRGKQDTGEQAIKI